MFKIFLTTVGTMTQKENVVLHPPLVFIVSILGSHSPTILIAKLDRNIKMFAYLFAQNDHFISTAASMQKMLPETINYVLN